jgi:hypothetical protein
MNGFADRGEIKAIPLGDDGGFVFADPDWFQNLPENSKPAVASFFVLFVSSD